MPLGDVIEPELCADMTIDASGRATSSCCRIRASASRFCGKAGDYDRWLEGTNRRLRRMRGEDV